MTPDQARAIIAKDGMVAACVTELSVLAQQVLSLRYEREFDFARIGEELHLPELRVIDIHDRALERIKEMLENRP